MARRYNLVTARDLGDAVRGARPDAADLITDDWCCEQLHALGETRYEDVDADLIDRICERVDGLAEAHPLVTVDDQPINGWLRLNARDEGESAKHFRARAGRYTADIVVLDGPFALTRTVDLV
jgi:hypothetical protein